MQTDDCAELERFKALGYREESGPLRKMGNVDTCECASEKTAQPELVEVKRPVRSARLSERPILSLKRG
jgi:hypothetical protein